MHSTRAAVSTTIRVTLARQRRSGRHLAQVLGMSAGAWHRRMAGAVAWDVDDLAGIARELGVPVADLVADLDDAAKVLS